MTKTDFTPSSQTRQDLTPALNLDRMRSPQNMPSSGPTTKSSSFLTPFLPGPHDTSPPPKLESEDYFNVRRYSNDGRMPKTRKDRNHHDDYRENEEPISRRHSSMSHSLPAVSARSECEACMLNTTHTEASNIQPEAMIRDMRDSPARNALQKLSQQQPPDGGSELQGRRRMSTALSGTLNFLRAKTPSIDSRLPDYGANLRITSRSQTKDPRRKIFSYHDEDGNCTTGKSRKDQAGLTTPTSIILRKASNARIPDLPRSSMSASLSREDEWMRAPDAPTSELLAFYSTHTERINQPESSRDRSSLSAQASTTLVDAMSYNKSPAPMGNPSSLRRRSTLAPAAMTFTDVHVAPGTFAVDPQSRRQSLVAPDQHPRRISVVHFKSRKSIHEVVWREDETTSGSSPNSDSRTSSSPPYPNPSVEYGLPPVRNAPTSPSLVALPQDNLFHWSWAKSTVSSVEEAPPKASNNKRPNMTRMASASNPDLSRPKRFPHALNTHRRSVSETQALLSFPPLRDRSSTLECCRAPLVDLGTPSRFRGQHDHTRDTTSSKESGTCVSSDKSLTGIEAKYRSSSHAKGRIV